MRDSPAATLNLCHPRSVSWNGIFEPIAKELNVPIVPYGDWLAKLDESLIHAKSEVEAVKENPALRLIEFFRTNGADKIPPGREAGGFPIMSTEVAVQVAESLTEAKLPLLGTEDALNWVKYWKSVGFLEA
jgi:hypothetical protein